MTLSGLATTPAGAQTRVDLTDEGWAISGRIDPETAEGQLALARRDFAAGEVRAAILGADSWLDAHPNSLLVPEARLLRGDALAANNDHWGALFDYEYIVRVHPGSDAFNRALEREYEIAKLYLGGMRRRMLGIPLFTAKGEAAELLIRIQERAPGSDLAEQSMLTLSDHYYDEGKMYLASEAYDLFLLNYPDTRHRQYGLLRLVLSHLAQFKGPRYDIANLLDAQYWLQVYQTEYPAAAQQIGAAGFEHRIRESMASKTLQTANFYLRREQQVSAAYTLQRLIDEFPATSAAAEAERLLLAMGDVPGIDSLASEPAAAEAEAVGLDFDAQTTPQESP